MRKPSIPIKSGDYEVVTFYHPEMGYSTEFFTPPTTGGMHCQIRKLALKLLVFEDYAERGYEKVCTLKVDQESYINLRLENVVEEYKAQEDTENLIKRQYHAGKCSMNTYIDTMRCTQDYKWTCIKRIDSLMRRLERHDYECYSETAIVIYNHYLAAIL